MLFIKNISDYLGAILYRTPAITANIMFGSQIASHGGISPVYTNIWLNLMNRMYEKLRAMPIARFHPMPPLFFLEDKATPIMVNMNAEKGSEKRVCFSINEYFTFGSPRSFWTLISSFSCSNGRSSTVFFLRKKSSTVRLMTVSSCSPHLTLSSSPDSLYSRMKYFSMSIRRWRRPTLHAPLRPWKPAGCSRLSRV